MHRGWLCLSLPGIPERYVQHWRRPLPMHLQRTLYLVARNLHPCLQASTPQSGGNGGSTGQDVDVQEVFEEAAVAVCERAALEGMPGAQSRLAEMYREGREVPTDLVTSYMWYLVCEQTNASMSEGIVLAKRKLAKLLTTEEVLEAQKLAQQRLQHVRKAGVQHKTMGTASGAQPAISARA